MSVADLLARHSGERADRRIDGLPTPRRATPHRALPIPDETDRILRGGVLAPDQTAGTDDTDDAPTSTIARLAPDDDADIDASPGTPEPGAGEPEGLALRARRIDESLTRLTAIHAGMGAEMTARVGRSSRLPVVARDGGPPDGHHPGARVRVWARSRPARVALVALAAAAFVTIGTGWGAKNWLDSQLHPVAALDPGSDAIVDPDAQRGDQNFLLVDAGSPAGAAGGAGAGPDTVLLAHLPAGRDRVVLVPFPRALPVPVPVCDRWDPASASYPGGTIPAQRAGTLPAAYQSGGPRCLTRAVQQLTGLSVGHFTAVDPASYPAMVQAVGGAPGCLGRPVLDLLRKGLSAPVVLHPGVLRDFVGAFGGHSLSDNAGLDELSTLVGALRTLDPAKVVLATVPATGADTVFAAIRADRPLPDERPARSVDDRARRAPTAATMAPNRVSLTVRNGSSRPGLANQVAENLRSVGFTVTRVGDAEPTEDGRTLIRHSPDRAEQADAVAASVPAAVTQLAGGQPGVLDLVLGDSFDGEVKAPVRPGGSGGATTAALAGFGEPDASCR